MTLYPRDAEDLHGYFSKLGYLEKSWAGSTYDRAWLYSEQVRPGGEITAYPTCKPPPNVWIDLNTDDLELMGRVSRKLRELSSLHRSALGLFYGDRGAVCAAKNHKIGRHVALFVLTPAGRIIVRRERKAQGRNRLRVSGAELIQNVVTRAELRAEERADLALALAQATKLRERAEAAYTTQSQALGAARLEAARAARKSALPVRYARDDGES